jgi:hypothetical protein
MNIACERSSDELIATVFGTAWHGDSLRDILQDVDAEQAQARPVRDAHSIWEIVMHLDAWIELFSGALRGIAIPEWAAMPKEQDWPPPEGQSQGQSELEWERCVSSLLKHHAAFAEAIAKFGDDRLESIVPGRSYNFNRLFHSASLHVAYHAGQIALLKKLLVRAL